MIVKLGLVITRSSFYGGWTELYAPSYVVVCQVAIKWLPESTGLMLGIETNQSVFSFVHVL